MAIQQGRDVIVAMKAQSVQGTEEATGGGGTKLLYKDGSPGMSPPQAALIESTVNIGDGLTERGRRGTYSIPGSYTLEAACGNHSIFYPIFFRNTWAAALTLDETAGAFSSATLSVSSNVITLSAGSWITAGIRVGDAVKFTTGIDAADLNKWLRVKALTATAMTVYETITNVAGPAATYDLTVPKKLLQGTSEQILTFDQYYVQHDRSFVVHDVKGNSLNFQLGENTTLDVTASVLGAGYAYKATGSSPHFTSPTTPTGTSLAFLDACFAINGGEVLNVTGFNIGLELSAAALAVANGCGTTPGKSPNIFQGNGKPTGQWSMAFDDFTLLTAAAGETQIDFIARFLDPNDADILQLSVLNAIMVNEQLSPLGQDGAAIQTFDLEIGRDKRGGAYDATSIKMFDTQA